MSFNKILLRRELTHVQTPGRLTPCRAACSDKVTSALTQLAGEGRSKAAFLGTVREAVGGLMQLAGRDAPPSVYLTLQHVRLARMTPYKPYKTLNPMACGLAPAVACAWTGSQPARSSTAGCCCGSGAAWQAHLLL